MTLLVTVVVCSVSMFHLAGGLYGWIRSLRLLGWNALPAARVALDLDRNRPRYLAHGARPHAVLFAVRFVIIAVAAGSLGLLVGQVLLIDLAVLILALGIGHLILHSIPPVVLYLSRSGLESQNTQVRLYNATQPYRLVAMLRSAESVTKSLNWASNIFKQGRMERGIIMNSDLRQVSEADWRDAVAKLLKVVPIIVLDARYSSDALREESALIRSGGFQGKTIVLVEDRPELAASSPHGAALFSDGSSEMSGMCVATAEGAWLLLREILASRRRMDMFRTGQIRELGLGAGLNPRVQRNLSVERPIDEFSRVSANALVGAAQRDPSHWMDIFTKRGVLCGATVFGAATFALGIAGRLLGGEVPLWKISLSSAAIGGAGGFLWGGIVALKAPGLALAAESQGEEAWKGVSFAGCQSGILLGIVFAIAYTLLRSVAGLGVHLIVAWVAYVLAGLWMGLTGSWLAFRSFSATR